MVRRSAVGFVLFAMLMSGAAPCGGWQPSAQARHDCCAEGMCPDAVGTMPDHGTMSQSAADQCCATSEEKGQRDSARLAAAIFAVPPPAAVDAVPRTGSTRPTRPPLHEISAALHPTARHVLFAVFLV